MENANYTLTAGTIITFRPRGVLEGQGPITRVITKIKQDCDTAEFPLVIDNGRVQVYRDVYIKVEGKKYSFLMKSVTLQPGFIKNETKNITKLLSADELFVKFCETEFSSEDDDSTNTDSNNNNEIKNDTKKVYCSSSNTSSVSTSERSKSDYGI